MLMAPFKVIQHLKVCLDLCLKNRNFKSEDFFLTKTSFLSYC
jgi:hypothetical protein